MANEGKYLNLKPHVDSWSIYTIEGPYVTDRRIGTLAPSQFGGLSYQVLEDRGGSVYTIQTESFGKVAIWAGDSDSTFTASPLYTSGATLPSGSTGKYVNLKPHVESWSIYNINGPYVPASRLGTLAPSQYGGLSYAIIESKGNHIYIIQTESFGQVAIWAGDSDSTFTSVPTYVDRVNGGGSEVDNGQGTGQYLNLHAHVSSWSIYNVAGPYIPANRIGTLAPAQFGGLSYAILGSPTTDVYIIQTESFGQVAIWAGDSDGSITGNPFYGSGSYTGGASGGTYLNLKPHVSSWSIFNVQGPYLVSNRIGTLAPSQFGGLSYRILETKGEDVYIIQTESFGKVAIWAGDNDSSFTSSPLYSGMGPVLGGGGDYTDWFDLSDASIVIKSRSEWGARAIQPAGMDGPLPAKKYIVIHHTVTADPQFDSDFEVMRSIQKGHQDKNWGDIGYHYCIGQHGNIMQGRPVEYAGAHVGRPHNFDSIGVSLFGNFMTHMPKDTQMAKLIPLLVTLCKTHTISPDNIVGHRDMDSNYGYTSCPGDYFYDRTNRLQDIRQAVKKKLDEDSRGESPQLLSPAAAKAETLNKINQYMNRMKWFEKIPYEITTWETEVNIMDTPVARIDISVSESVRKEVTLDGIVLEPQFNLNLSEGMPILEDPLSNWLRDKSLPEVEVISMDEAFQTLANETRNVGSVSVSYTMNAECFLITVYTVQFTALHLSDGTTAKATVQVSVGIKRVNLPGPQAVPVTRKDLNTEERNLIDIILESAQGVANRSYNDLISIGIPSSYTQNLSSVVYVFVLIGMVMVMIVAMA